MPVRIKDAEVPMTFFRCFVPSAVLALLASVGLAAASPEPGLERATAPAEPRDTVEIRYEAGSLSARFDSVPLQQALNAIAARTDIDVHISDPQIGAKPVSAQLQSAPLAAALAEVLGGYSYALSMDPESRTLVVLSTSPSPRSQPQAAGQGTVAAIHEGAAVGAEETSKGGSIGGGSMSDRASEGAPETSAPDPQLQNPATSSAEGQEDARLEHAITALQSPLGNETREQAFEGLVGVSDPRATETLIAAATAGEPGLRGRAVQALWQHAAELEFADPSVNEALKQLSQDSDVSVRTIARRALKSLQHREQAAAERN